MIFFLYSLMLQAALANPNCYPLTRPGIEGSTVETWCYERTEEGGLNVFNADEDVKPELAMRVDVNGWITHGSLARGEVTRHRVHGAEINPLGLPLTEPVMVTPMSFNLSARQLADARRIFLEFARDPLIHPFSARARDGTLRAQAEFLPWRGTSWSFKNQEMYTGVDSPLAKFDRWVFRTEGVDPGVNAWETTNHGDGYWWGGHCNGWAVSSILRKEPMKPVWDSKTGVSFKIAHLKGLLAAKDFCAKIAMFGERNNAPEIDRTDIDPALFHKTLMYYVGELKKPLAVDYRPDEVVDTHVITGYLIRIFEIGPGTWRVNTRVDIHKYDQRSSNKVGPAGAYTRDYIYDLYVNESSEVLSGVWHSDNPDFIYAPLSTQYCPDRHPHLTEDRLQKILALPEI